jgi:hypothetical protein
MKYPKNLYVKWEEPGNDQPYLNACDDMSSFVEVGEKTTVGIYKLVATQEIEGMIETRKAKPVNG